VGAYAKRTRLFEEIQEDKNEKDADQHQIFYLENMSATRWTTRVKAVDVTFEKAHDLRKTLKDDPCV